MIPLKTKLYILFFFLCTSLFSQELPPIVKYAPTTYEAGNQNWMISQDENHFVYFANNEGLLEFNGSNWSLYKSPNETIVRSVKVIGNNIFTGSYMEFGFWAQLDKSYNRGISLTYKEVLRIAGNYDVKLPDEH